MHIAYYITAHGYGHALRSATIAKKISPYVKITFKTDVPIYFFYEEFDNERNFEYEKSKIDCGCVQRDSINVDIKETFNEYSKIVRKSNAIIEREVKWCKEKGIKGIVSDIPAITFEIAKRAGVPSVAVTNFTWYDVYKEYLAFEPLFEPILEEMLNQYRNATSLLALFPSLPMDYFKNKKEISLVGRKGKKDREIFKKITDISDNKKIALIYVGNFGLSCRWKRLLEFDNWEFLGLYPLKDAPSNYHLIDKRLVKYPDLIASSDCVIGKAGYGVVAECMLNRTPLIFLPRENFAEYPVLEEAIKKWGGGIKIGVKDFFSLNFGETLEKVNIISSSLPIFPDDGAKKCAQAIEEIIFSHYK